MLVTAGNLLVADPVATDPRLINTVHVLGGRLSLGGVLAGSSVLQERDGFGSVGVSDLFESFSD